MRFPAAVLLLVLLSLRSVVHAQVIDHVEQFDVRAQPLGDALRIVVSQANANLMYDPSLVKGRTVEAFSITATLDEALVRMLEGSGLKHQYVDEKTVTLVKVGPETPAVSDSAQQQSGPKILGREKAPTVSSALTRVGAAKK